MTQVQEQKDLTRLLAPHKGKWVALSHDHKTVVGVGTSIEIALRKAKEEGEDRPLLVKSPDKYMFSL